MSGRRRNKQLDECQRLERPRPLKNIFQNAICDRAGEYQGNSHEDCGVSMPLFNKQDNYANDPDDPQFARVCKGDHDKIGNGIMKVLMDELNRFHIDVFDEIYHAAAFSDFGKCLFHPFSSADTSGTP